MRRWYLVLLLGAFGIWVWQAFFPSLPLVLRSIAVSSDGTRVAASIYDHKRVGWYVTKVFRLTDSGVTVEAVEASTNSPGYVCGVSRNGCVLKNDRGTLHCTCSGSRGPVDSESTPTYDAGFTSEAEQRIVAWSRTRVVVFESCEMSERWELPLQDDREIAAVNWSGDPARIVVLTTARGSRLTIRVEIWSVGNVVPLDVWTLPQEIELSDCVAVNPLGTSVVLCRSFGNHCQVTVLQKVRPDVVTSFSDVPCAAYGRISDYDVVVETWLRFIDDNQALFVDHAGGLIIVDCSIPAWSRVPRKGETCDQLSVAANGSVIAIGRRLTRAFEIWHHDRNGINKWLTVDVK